MQSRQSRAAGRPVQEQEQAAAPARMLLMASSVSARILLSAGLVLARASCINLHRSAPEKYYQTEQPGVLLADDLQFMFNSSSNQKERPLDLDQHAVETEVIIKSNGRRTYVQLGVLGLPEGLALGGVATTGALLLAVVVLRPPLIRPLEILQEAQHHVRQAHLAVYRLPHHHGVCVCARCDLGSLLLARKATVLSVPLRLGRP